jgi:hypothetical protein
MELKIHTIPTNKKNNNFMFHFKEKWYFFYQTIEV